MSSSEAPQMLLHYRLGPKIGSGGMGEVYKAEDTCAERLRLAGIVDLEFGRGSASTAGRGLASLLNGDNG